MVTSLIDSVHSNWNKCNKIYIDNVIFNGTTCMVLTLWGRVMHICVDNLTIIGSDNGFIAWTAPSHYLTNAGILLIRTLGTNFSELLSVIHLFSFKKSHFKISSEKMQPFCLSLNVLKQIFKFHSTSHSFNFPFPHNRPSLPQNAHPQSFQLPWFWFHPLRLQSKLLLMITQHDYTLITLDDITGFHITSSGEPFTSH